MSTLRARLILLVTAAVAVAVTLAAAGCWFMVRDQLRGQLDRDLERRQPGPRLVAALERHCTARPDGYRAYRFSVQVVRPSGPGCAIGTPLAVTAADRAVASTGGSLLRDGVTLPEGAHARISVRAVAPGAAVAVARPLEEIEGTLRNLAWLLGAVAAGGVLAAVLSGVGIARAALRPVDGLTGAVGHIARTGDLDHPLPSAPLAEIARLGAAFTALTGALASSRERQRRLVADAGHELRTPLASLRANIDLLARSDRLGRPLPPGHRARLLADLQEQARELTELTGDLLELARDNAPGAARPVAFHETVEQAVRRARPRSPDARWRIDLQPWTVRADPSALERAVVNLLDNALKFAPPGSCVGVELREGVLTVTDEGPGIGADDLPYVFDRFWRSPTARSVPGSGLGLAIAAQTVRDAGGRISLECPPSGGTVARITLPGPR